MKSPAQSLTKTTWADIDRNTTLCLACASSLPPLKTTNGLLGESPMGVREVFITQCCGRPICPRCVTANPRLERYNPCLVCLGGVGVVRSGANMPISPHMNIDGALRDEATFVLGDEDEDEDVGFGDHKQGDQTHNDDATQPATSHPTSVDLEHSNNDTLDDTTSNVPPEALTPSQASSSKYYITQSDTLQGIALRFGLDGREICRLNSLPPSTLSTTPHLLHTRRFLTLPPSALHHLGLSNTEEEREREVQHSSRSRRERAEKRLQTATKEVDWRVAKAYIALADDLCDETGEADEYNRKRKEAGILSGPISGPSTLEERAIEQYLDDEEWEAMRRMDGGKAGPSNFRAVGGSEDRTKPGGEKDCGGDRRWWQWKF